MVNLKWNFWGQDVKDNHKVGIITPLLILNIFRKYFNL